MIIVGWLSKAAISQILGEKNALWICLAVGIGFILAVIVAVFTKPASSHTAQPPVERQAIKGLLSFTATDAEIFSQLQRNQDIKNCLRMIKEANFHIGFLWGESGCGKTSFLQAGLIPELTKLEQDQGIYIQFSDKDPLITIKKALNKDLKLNLSVEEIEQLDLMRSFLSRY